MPFRLGVLVSGEGTNLQAILDSVHGREGVEVACVGSSRAAARGLERARRAGVESRAFEKGDYSDRAHRDAAIGDWLAEHGVDLVVLAGFMELLSPELIARFRDRVINVHPSLLPAFPGTRAIEQAMEYGAKVGGVTVHYVDEGVDTGRIILQEAFELPYAAGIEGVAQRVHEVEHELLPRVIRLIARGGVAFDPDRPRRVVVEGEA